MWAAARGLGLGGVGWAGGKIYEESTHDGT